MMRIHLVLSNPERSYSAGHVVNGHVVINNPKKETVKGVTAILEGHAAVEINDGNFPPSHSKEQVFLSMKESLATDEEDNGMITISEGMSTYPFTFLLPSNAPSSVNDLGCQVTYSLAAVVHRFPFKRKATSHRKTFGVTGTYDHSEDREAQLTQQCRKMKEYNIFRRKEQISLVLSLLNGPSYVPEERMDFRVEIINNSGRKIYKAMASLRQVTKSYHQTVVNQSGTKTIAKVKGPGVGKWESNVWEASLSIPSILPPTRLGGLLGNIMDNIRYVLHVELTISGVRDLGTLVGEVPVKIGRVPRRATLEGVYIPIPDGGRNNPPVSLEQSDSNQNNAPERLTFTAEDYADDSETDPVLPDYDDLAPPSYVEAVGGEAASFPVVNEACNPTASAPSIEEFTVQLRLS